MVEQAHPLSSMTVERTALAPVAPGAAELPSRAPPPLAPSTARAPAAASTSSTGMQVQSLLNDSAGRVRPSSFYQPAPPPREPGVVDGSHTTSAAPAFAPPPQARLANAGPPPRHLASGARPPVSAVMQSASPDLVYDALQNLRDALAEFPNAQELVAESAKVVTVLFNTYSEPTHSAYWSAWVLFSSLCKALNLPVFPIQPDKVALVLSAHLNLPCSPSLRVPAGLTTLRPDQAIEALEALKAAGLATRHLWPNVRCFVRDAVDYEALVVLLNGASGSGTASTRVFHPPPAPHDPSPPLLIRDVTSRPMLTSIPPAPAPQVPVYASDRLASSASYPRRPAPRSLRSVCDDLTTWLRQLQAEPSDLIAFEVAGERFQATAASPAFADRMPSLFNAATIYTHITAVLSFPTYPITTAKLAAFALAMTPGPLGQHLDAAAPFLPQRREVPRGTGKQLEMLLKDVTQLRMVTRGGDEHVPDEEKSEWRRWWSEITEDWRGSDKLEPAGKRPSQPASRKLKRSLSPSDSEASTASSTRPRSTPASSATGKAAREPRSRLHPTTAPSSRASSISRAGTPSAPSSRASGKRAPSPLDTPPSFERYVPPRVGILPEDPHEPPIPPILACPWWVPKKKRIVKPEGENGSVNGNEEDEENDSEYEDAVKREAMGRSIATHRPKRGGLDMRPFDVSALWG
ncbi:hypothetical protein JCM10213v2_007659 [Rhodosporidiobolus nylandii]